MNPDQVGGPPLSANNAAAEKVFSNTLFWKITGSYLNVGDLKACRLVNSEFHGMIMKETNFLQRCVLSLKPAHITRNIFGRTSELWKNVILKFQGPSDGLYWWLSDEDLNNLQCLYPVIANVESLSLRLKTGTDGYLFPLLKLLLLASKKLRSLAVEPIFLVSGTGGHFEDLKEMLGKLEEFEILRPSPTWVTHVDSFGAVRAIDRWWLSADFIKKLENLQVVRSYYPIVPVLPGFGLAWMSILFECEILTSVLGRIAHQSSKTLKHVALGELSFMDHLEGLSPSLRIMSDKFQPAAVTKFFEAMPMLQGLDFLSLNKVSFPMEILNVINEGSDRLRKVKLGSLCFNGTKWEFLEKTKLEEFQMELLDPCSGNTLPGEAQNYLPSTIRRLFLRGPLESNPVLALRRLNPTLVTELTFIDSGDCFGDDAIKYIRENFVMLRKLNVTNAKAVTDAGFIGLSSGSGPLSGIKGLRTLILRKCGSITDATLREIRFLELCFLDLAYNESLTEGGLQGVLSNNSSLETLLTPCKSVHRKREQLCASHPRLSSIIYRGWN